MNGAAPIGTERSGGNSSLLSRPDRRQAAGGGHRSSGYRPPLVTVTSFPLEAGPSGPAGVFGPPTGRRG